MATALRTPHLRANKGSQTVARHSIRHSSRSEKLHTIHGPAADPGGPPAQTGPPALTSFPLAKKSAALSAPRTCPLNCACLQSVEVGMPSLAVLLLQRQSRPSSVVAGCLNCHGWTWPRPSVWGRVYMYLCGGVGDTTQATKTSGAEAPNHQKPKKNYQKKKDFPSRSSHKFPTNDFSIFFHLPTISLIKVNWQGLSHNLPLQSLPTNSHNFPTNQGARFSYTHGERRVRAQLYIGFSHGLPAVQFRKCSAVSDKNLASRTSADTKTNSRSSCVATAVNRATKDSPSALRARFSAAGSFFKVCRAWTRCLADLQVTHLQVKWVLRALLSHHERHEQHLCRGGRLLQTQGLQQKDAKVAAVDVALWVWLLRPQNNGQTDGQQPQLYFSQAELR